MRCTTILLCLMCIMLSGHTLSAQVYTVYVDNFTKKAKNWPLSDNAYYYTYLRGDRYGMYRKSAAATNLFYKPVPFKQNVFFEIESTLYSAGDDGKGIGMAWGIKDEKNYYAFLISTSARSYKVVQYQNGDYMDMIPWTKSPLAIRMSGKANDLLIRHSGDSLSFYINGRYMESRPFESFKENGLGFVVNDPINVQAENLIVRAKGKLNLVSTLNKDLKRERLDNNINCGFDDHLPIITPDGKTLYICRKHPENMGGTADQDDIWYATMNKDSTWSEMRNMGPPLNNIMTNGVLSATPDNNTLLLNGSYPTDLLNYTAAAYSMTHKTRDGWSMPEPVIIDNYYNDNTYVSVNLSSDGKTMLLGLERDEGFGDADIYVCFLQENGHWSTPMNLGSMVNTPGQEHDPFLAADGVTLYYSTEGKPGYGGKDIFVTRRLDDTWKHWSEPQNLGPLVNTPQDDEEFVLAASGAYAYFSSEVRPGNRDIFRLKMNEAAKPKAVAIVSGKVSSCKTKQGIAAQLTYVDLSTNKEAGVANASPVDGTFKLTLPAGKKYLLRTEDENQLTVTDTIDVSKEQVYTEITKDIVLCPVEKPAYVPSDIEDRKINIQQTVAVKNKKITLQIWDDEMEDGDIISLNVNGQWVLDKYTLRKAKKTITIDVDPAGSYIVMYAHNEGTNPPNTAAVSIIDGGVEKRLKLKSTLRASAAINLVYQP